MQATAGDVLDLLVELIHCLRSLAHHHAIDVDVLGGVTGAGAIVLLALLVYQQLNRKGEGRECLLPERAVALGDVDRLYVLAELHADALAE